MRALHDVFYDMFYGTEVHVKRCKCSWYTNGAGDGAKPGAKGTGVAGQKHVLDGESASGSWTKHVCLFLLREEKTYL